MAGNSEALMAELPLSFERLHTNKGEAAALEGGLAIPFRKHCVLRQDP
jgi:hypothetical protein